MDQQVILAKIEEIAVQLFRDTEPMSDQPENLFYTYSMTSIDVLEYLLAIETEFGFEFDDSDLTEATVTDRARLVNLILHSLNDKVSQ